MSAPPSNEEALRQLWALWNDPQWVKYKADYLRGHKSYWSMLETMEAPIVAALLQATPAPEKQEPVAWLVEWGDGPPASCYTEIEIMESVVEREAMNGGWVNTVIPLYRAPQADARLAVIEECARVCDRMAEKYDTDDACESCATAIRALAQEG